VGGGNAEEEVIEVVDKGSLGIVAPRARNFSFLVL